MADYRVTIAGIDPESCVALYDGDRKVTEMTLNAAIAFSAEFPDELQKIAESDWRALKLVESGNVHGAVYKVSTSTLRVQFKNGRVYDYFGVTQSVVRKFEAAESSGKFLAAVLKNEERYPCRKVVEA